MTTKNIIPTQNVLLMRLPCAFHKLGRFWHWENKEKGWLMTHGAIVEESKSDCWKILAIKKTWLGLISKTCRGSHSCLLLPTLYWPIRELHLWARPIRSQDPAKPNRTAWWDRQPPQEQGPTLTLWCWDVGGKSGAQGHSSCFASVIQIQSWVVILSQLVSP